jgi:hypothetical protein
MTKEQFIKSNIIMMKIEELEESLKNFNSLPDLEIVGSCDDDGYVEFPESIREIIKRSIEQVHREEIAKLTKEFESI